MVTKTADPPVTSIELTVETDVSPTEAWAALTRPDRVTDWLTDVSPLGTVGSPYRLDFGDGSVVEGVVLGLDPGRSFSYTWAWAGIEPREETTVAWTITTRPGGGSTIFLRHDGWAEAGLDGNARDDHAGYWTGYLDDLAAVLAERA